MKKLLLVSCFVFVLVGCGQKVVENNNQQVEIKEVKKEIPAKEEIVKEEVKEKEVNVNEVVVNDETKKPEWYGKNFKITTIAEGYDAKQINVWYSFEDRNNSVFSLQNNDEVVLIGFDDEHDYCQIKKGDKTGWMACAWIVGISKDMKDYWDN